MSTAAFLFKDFKLDYVSCFISFCNAKHRNLQFQSEILIFFAILPEAVLPLFILKGCQLQLLYVAECTVYHVDAAIWCFCSLL